jgi:hypothetical protein
LAHQKIASETASQEQVKGQSKEQSKGQEAQIHYDRRSLEAAPQSPTDDSRAQLFGHRLTDSQLEFSHRPDSLGTRLAIDHQPSAAWGTIDDLLEKEQHPTRQSYERQLQSLEAKIEQQAEQITELSMQLQSAMRQAQKLAIRVQRSSIRIAARDM